MIRWIGTLCGIAVILFALWMLWPAPSTVRSMVVQSQRVPHVLHEHTVLISAQRTPSKSGIKGTITRIVTPGTHVKPGDELFTQDAEDLEQRIEQYQTEIEEQRAGLEQHRQEMTLAELELSKQEEINAAELAYQNFRLKHTMAGQTANERRLTEIQLELARIDLTEAKEALERSKRLVERGLQSSSQLEDAQRTYTARATAVQELEIEQELNNAGPTLVEVREIQADQERVQGKVDRGRQSRERRINRINRDIAIREAQISKTSRQLSDAEEDADKATRRAEVAGIAMPKSYRDWRSGGRKISIGPGVNRWPGDVIVDVIDPSKLQAVIMLNESDYPRLRTGMPVTIRIAAYPDETFTGQISFLAGIARDRGEISTNQTEGANTGVSVFSATIDFETTVELRPGMSGTVDIVLEDSFSALVIPNDWAQSNKSQYWVWREDSNGTEKVSISAAPYGGNGLRIIDGLSEGDRLRHPLDMGEAP